MTPGTIGTKQFTEPIHLPSFQRRPPHLSRATGATPSSPLGRARNSSADGDFQYSSRTTRRHSCLCTCSSKSPPPSPCRRSHPSRWSRRGTLTPQGRMALTVWMANHLTTYVKGAGYVLARVSLRSMGSKGFLPKGGLWLRRRRRRTTRSDSLDHCTAVGFVCVMQDT